MNSGPVVDSCGYRLLIRRAILKSTIISLSISADEFERLYRGTAKEVIAYSFEGLRIRFPANILRPYVLHSGVHGIFQIDFDEENRFQAIKRLR